MRESIVHNQNKTTLGKARQIQSCLNRGVIYMSDFFSSESLLPGCKNMSLTSFRLAMSSAKSYKVKIANKFELCLACAGRQFRRANLGSEGSCRLKRKLLQLATFIFVA